MIHTLGRYSITYWNGIHQNKSLISRKEYNEVVKPIILVCQGVESRMEGLSKKSSEYKELSLELKKAEYPLKELGEYFVKGSPLYLAISTNKLTLPDYKGLGGILTKEVTINKLI